MKRNADRFRKECERAGNILSTKRTYPLAPWFTDRTLLPKEPPNRTKTGPEEDNDNAPISDRDRSA